MFMVYALFGLVVGGVINYLADRLPRRRSKSRQALLIRWLVTELVTAAVFALLYVQPRFADPLLLVLVSFHTSVLILLTITDLEHRRIPNKIIVPAIAVATLTSPLLFYTGWFLALIGGAIGYGFFWLVAVIGGKAIGRGAMGGGDVKLAAFVGLITGFPGVITALVVTILAGGLISALLLLVRVVNLRSGIPYGPFLVLGGFMTMVWGQQIMTRFFFGG